MTVGITNAAASIDETGRALLAAAHDLLASEGPTALTVRRIAGAAGVSTMNVYSRFGGKDGVLDELFVDGFRRLGERMEDTRRPTTPSPICGRAAPTATSPAENPTYYSLMFDRVGARLRAVCDAKEVAHATLGHLASASNGRWSVE